MDMYFFICMRGTVRICGELEAVRAEKQPALSSIYFLLRSVCARVEPVVSTCVLGKSRGREYIEDRAGCFSAIYFVGEVRVLVVFQDLVFYQVPEALGVEVGGYMAVGFEAGGVVVVAVGAAVAFGGGAVDGDVHVAEGQKVGFLEYGDGYGVVYGGLWHAVDAAFGFAVGGHEVVKQFGCRVVLGAHAGYGFGVAEGL